MRKNIRAADVTDWCNDKIRETIAEVNKQYQTFERIHQLNGKTEAFIEVIDLCERLLETEPDEN